MKTLFFIVWYLYWGALALGELNNGVINISWFPLAMFLSIPVIWLVSFVYSLTPGGRARAERLRRERAYAVSQLALRSTVQPSSPVTKSPSASELGHVSNRQAMKPGQLLHPTPENFESYCKDWCEYLGYHGAVKTQNSRDGGIDVKSANMIAQVKFQVSPVGVKAVRELNGVRKPGQEVLFFALNGFTPEARREATEMNITLIRVSPLDGQIDILG